MTPPPQWPRRHRTRPGPPRWSQAGRGRRVLVEHPDPRVREVLERRLAEHGYQVLTCAGPGDHESATVCPVLRDETCPAVVEADAVVCALERGHAAHDAIVDRIGRMHPTLPLIADADLRPTLPKGEVGSHRFYRTTVAPLVRRLYDVMVLNRTP